MSGWTGCLFLRYVTTFSVEQALTYGLNTGVGAFAVIFLLSCIIAHGKEARKRRLWQLGVGAFVLCAVLTVCTYAALPKTKVRLVKNPLGMSYQALCELYWWVRDTIRVAVTRAEITAEARRVIANLTDEVSFVKSAKDHGGKGWDNFILGGNIRVEDSRAISRSAKMWTY